MFSQIDRLNLEGYANLDHWVAELDKRIEGILLQRLKHIINVWCQEFDRADDGERRDTAVNSKRRGDRRKDEKVVDAARLEPYDLTMTTGTRRRARPQTYRTRDSHPESSDLPRSTRRVCTSNLDSSTTRMAWCGVPAPKDPKFAIRDWLTDAKLLGYRVNLHFPGE
jgi:hypothetical protein